MSEKDVQFGVAVRRWRKLADLKQDQVARMIGVSGSLISSIESGRKPATGRTLTSLTELMSRNPEVFQESTDKDRPYKPATREDLMDALEAVAGRITGRALPKEELTLLQLYRHNPLFRRVAQTWVEMCPPTELPPKKPDS